MLKLLGLAILAVFCFSRLTAAEDTRPLPPGFEGLEPVLQHVPLEAVPAAIPALSSPSARDRAGPFAEVIAKASGFFERTLGWRSDFRLVVLDAEDWGKVTTVPYPAPHVWNRERLVVMPDSLARYPGFDVWKFNDLRLNEILTVHEIGHALVHAHAIPWSDMDHTVNELLANVMMAGFLYDAMPEMARLLDGAPEGFDPPGTASLADFDYFYVGVGLERYAWFQFELARAAGFMVREKLLGELMPLLVGRLKPAKGDLPPVLLERLEAVVPGVTASFSAFSASQLPETSGGPCEHTTAIPAFTGWSSLSIENRSSKDLIFRNLRDEKELTDFQIEIGLTPENNPGEFVYAPTIIPPGTKWIEKDVAGLDLVIEGRDCVRIPSAPGRFVARD